MPIELRPGQVFLADAHQFGTRPVIIVSREPLNRGDAAVVVPCTTTNLAKRAAFPNCVFFRAGQCGLTKDCVAQAEGITALPIGQLLLDAGPIGELDEAKFRELIRAVGYAIGSECEPV